MRTRSKKIVVFLALVALTAVSTLALADTPTRVGRVALAQGQVSVSAEVGEEMSQAALNWPLTSHNQISTGRDGRTEIKVGSTAIRLDGDSLLEITELDDDTLNLHLHYGSANVRIRNGEVLRGFRLSTPQGQVRMQEPGRFRVDAERTPDTTAINVFEGVLLVDGGNTTVTVRAGKRAELHQDDVRTGLAVHDGFDDWARLRDQRDERAVSDRYVSREMTGYEDLDQYGMWRDDPEYGALWFPRSVPAGWVPYRDGRWTWVSPWGWTWVDNAPWGYAPFHYGRWVLVNNRWCWAPGRNVGRPVWAPALVGWVGGSNWQLNFNSRGTRRPAPAQGWYPLAPRESFVPGYRLSQDHLHIINRHARPDGAQAGRGRGRGPDHRQAGLTVVPQAQFGQRGTIVVPSAPRAVVPPLALQNAPVAPPPLPHAVVREREPRVDHRDERGGRFDRHDRGERFDRNDRGVRFDRDDRTFRNDRGDRFDRDDRNEGWRGRVERPAPVVQQPQQQPQQHQPPQPVVAAPAPNPGAPAARGPMSRTEARGVYEAEQRRLRALSAPQQQVQPQPQAQPQPQPVVTAPPGGAPSRRGFENRGPDGDHRRGRPMPTPPEAAAAPQQPHPQGQAQPHAQPQPVMTAPPAAAPSPRGAPQQPALVAPPPPVQVARPAPPPQQPVQVARPALPPPPPVQVARPALPPPPPVQVARPTPAPPQALPASAQAAPGLPAAASAQHNNAGREERHRRDRNEQRGARDGRPD